MIKDLSKLSKNTLIYGLGNVFQKFLSLLLLPFFSRILSPEDYGILSLLSLLTSLLLTVSTLGTQNSLNILYFKNMNEKDYDNSLISSNFYLLTILNFLILIIIVIFSKKISNIIFQSTIYNSYIILSFIGFMIGIIADPFNSYLRMENKIIKYVIVTLISSTITLATNIIFVVNLRLGITGLLLATIVSNFIRLLLLIFLTQKYLNFKINIKYIKPLITIGFPSIFGLFAFLLIDYADRQMIQRIIGIEKLGIYSIGYNFGMIMIIFVNSFSTAWTPFFMSYIDKLSEANALFRKILNYYIICAGFIVLLFFAFARLIVVIMVAPEYIAAYKVVGLVSLSYMLKGCYLILLPSIYFTGRLIYQSLSEWIAAIINIFLNIVLIKYIGIEGAALSTLISYLCLSICINYYGKKNTKINYDIKGNTKIISLYSFTCLIIFYFNIYLNLLQSLILSIIIILFVSLWLYKKYKNNLSLLLNTYKKRSGINA